MTSYRKKLIEVALPLKAINEASAREKSIRHGHPSTLHLWWARRPLAACRAVLFASLVDDPDSDPAYRRADGTVDEERAGIKRAELFNLIEELVRWENSNNPRVINAARAEIARCVASRKIELGELQKDTVVFEPRRSLTSAEPSLTLRVSVADTDPKRQRGLEPDGGQSARTPAPNPLRVGQPHPRGPVSGDGITAWEVLLMKARPEVVNAFLADYAPPVLDPFCGGGSIPLEAQRLGLRAYASDLNPVPVLITKALIEIPPKFAGRPPVNPDWQTKSKEQKATTVWHGAQGLAEDVRYYGQWMRDDAEKRIGHLYPKVKITEEMAKDRPDLKKYVGQELTVIAWLWARTVASPNPACAGVHVPLVRSFWLSSKKGKCAWIEPDVDRSNSSYEFKIHTTKPPASFDPGRGTKEARGASFRCILSGTSIPKDYIRDQFQKKRHGAVLMAVVAEGDRGRVYLPPVENHADVARSSSPRWRPELEMNTNCRDLVSGRGYGITKWHEIFTDRQLIALTTLSELVGAARTRAVADAKAAWPSTPIDDRPLAAGGVGPCAYADAIATYLGLAVSKLSDALNSLTRWKPSMDQAIAAFGRQALPMVWDFAESNTFNGKAGDLETTLGTIVRALANLPVGPVGEVTQIDATAALPDCRNPMCCTDPPYYDNIGYADLSDFFYLWLRQSLSALYPSLFATVLTPKAQELVATPYRHEGSRERAQQFFEEGLRNAFNGLQKVQDVHCPFTVYYAFKQAETEDADGDDDETAARTTASTGWETMLAGLIKSGFSVSGTWPMRTELGNRMVGSGTNALASSIVLVCRPRPGDAALATRKEFMNALRQELPEALKNLQHGNIAPVDLAQASIGPGMAVFTRYAKVIESNGSPMTVRTALGIINQVLDEVLAEQEGDFDPDTRWALAWFDQYGAGEGPFGVAETLSKAKNTAVNGLVEAGVVKARAGKVQLVGRADLSDGWDPAADRRLTVWETTQHLIRTLETKGESEAAALLNRLGGIAETARELAYRLYSICERKKWADEALAYNGLVIAWPELTKLARSAATRSTAVQTEMF